MQGTSMDPHRIRAAWHGQVAGCLLGDPVEVPSFRGVRDALTARLRDANALPLRDYVPLIGDVVDPTIAVAESIGTRR